jgi:hypothetical protein
VVSAGDAVEPAAVEAYTANLAKASYKVVASVLLGGERVDVPKHSLNPGPVQAVPATELALQAR